VAMQALIADQECVWKSGVLLKKDKTVAEVVENYDRREIKIRIAGRHKKELLTLVTYELDKIHATYHRLKVNQLIPCNCPTCRGSQEPHFYSFGVLRKFTEAEQDNIQCQQSFQMVNVWGMIDDVVDRSRLHRGRGGFEEEIHFARPALDLEPESASAQELFISYAWGGESEKIVNELDGAFQAKGITIVRDKRDLGFKGRIREFMEGLGRGKGVIVVISQKYLESENCMFELVEIAKNGEFYDRIFPIVLEDANIYKPTDRIKYVKYWEEQIRQLEEAMRTVGQANLQGIREDIDSYTQIRGTIADLVNTLKDMNALTLEMHRKSGFAELIEAVERKMAE